MIHTSTHAPHVMPSIRSSHFSDAKPEPATSGSSSFRESSTWPEDGERGVRRRLSAAERPAMTGVMGVLGAMGGASRGR